jgi:putative transposase
VNRNRRHNRRSLRLRSFDYSAPGAYFVTLVTQDRVALFGEVVEREMRMNAAGEMVRATWHALPERFRGIEVGESVVMPNHFHGIVVLLGNVGAGLVPARTPKDSNPRAATRAAPTKPTLGIVIGAFKSLAARSYMRGVEEEGWPAFQQRLWQRNYYEHILRDEADWDRIHRYIQTNPMNWHQDEENPPGTPGGDIRHLDK